MYIKASLCMTGFYWVWMCNIKFKLVIDKFEFRFKLLMLQMHGILL